MLCPFCKEEIKDEAIKCKHCGSMLNGSAQPQVSGAPVQAEPIKAASGEGLGYLMLIIPVIAILLMWFWVGEMNMLQSPGSTLTFVVIAAIIATAIIATHEANLLGFGKDKAKSGKMSESSPIGIFFGMILLWIVVYPLYLFQRSKKGKKNLVVGGTVLAIAFAASWYYLYTAIAKRVSELQNIFK